MELRYYAICRECDKDRKMFGTSETNARTTLDNRCHYCGKTADLCFPLISRTETVQSDH